MWGKGTSGVGILAAFALIVWALVNPGTADQRQALNGLGPSPGGTPLAFPTDLALPDDLGAIDPDQLDAIVREELEKLAAEYLSEYDPEQAYAALASRIPDFSSLAAQVPNLSQLAAALQGAQQPAGSPDLAAQYGLDPAALAQLFGPYLNDPGSSSQGIGPTTRPGPVAGSETDLFGLDGPAGLGADGKPGYDGKQFADDMDELAGELEKMFGQ